MSSAYFKARKPFDFHPHPYELGNILGLKKGRAGNHFLLKIYGLNAAAYEDYYQFHLQHYLPKKTGTEKEFLKHVWDTVQNRITYYQLQDPFSSRYPLYLSNIERLETFQEYVAKRDRWNIRPNSVLLKEKDELIAKLQKEVGELKGYRVSRKIQVYEDHFTTVIDLFHQMQKLKLPNGAPLLRRDQQSPYYKIISNYFSDNKKNISIETARNYFVEKKSEERTKGSEVPEDKKLFLIVPKKDK